jgi:hypothetical protein
MMLFGFSGSLQAAEYSLPKQVRVMPVAFVPMDEKVPSTEQKKVFLRHIEWTQRRYRELLGGDTYELSGETVTVVKGRRPLSYYRNAKENGAPDVTAELLTHFKVSRFSCPYVFCIILMNPHDSFPVGGGRPINGGMNTGGGMMFIGSGELIRNQHFQCTLQHELGHSFGMAHPDVYGYDMKSSDSLMSYNKAHHNKVFQPSPTPGKLIPEDRRVLAFNGLVFPKTTFDPQRDVPNGYALSKRIVPLGPMDLPDHPDFYPTVTTTAGEEVGSKVGNIVREEIKQSAGPGITYDKRTMWHSKPLPDGLATLEITFPMPVRLSGIAIHSQHSNRDHQATAMRLDAVKGDVRTSVAEQQVKSVDALVTFPLVESATWTLRMESGKSKILVIRGLRFFDGDEEVCPHMVPYAVSAATSVSASR